ncbi:hypothetical protein E1A91_D01G045600v1 [Gossypium mustelinum]|uniref:Uncharacterized protein n=1 Tax=Gossypium mustelinum TaxID=34275 RepID=A0A5D2W351_GOSMU|nr:hypothetical protein E1A91_D01G045600v1 [Gossypium mustelinum]
MGGIGKTTIVKHIYYQLLKETKPLFDKIIWVTVSKELNIPKLQQNLANAMNIVGLPESEPERVAVLMDKLGQRRYVLILDDVWKSSLWQSKLVLTSRSIEVCISLDCTVVKVPPLSKKESMNLFLEHAGRGVLKVPSLKEILDDIVRECDGLPLAITVIAGSMKGIYDVAEWRNALRELRDHVRSVKGADIEIYERLKFSFDRLGDLKIQSCFLYCSLYPEDYIIPREELIEYWIDEEFLGTGSRQELYDKGHTILNRLENNSLLENVGGDSVKMHDVMRDTALYIKGSGSRFKVQSGVGLKELPSKQEWGEDLEKVSFMVNNVSEIPSHLSPNCEVLSTLLLQKNESLQRISGSFFQHMHRLSILDLSYTNVKQLPTSVSNLENLKALVLRGCYNLRYVPSLEKLEALRKLDLSRTAIEKVPKGLEMLSNLTYLNLCTESLKELPVAILPRLSCLQCLILYVESSRVKMNGFDAARLTKLERFEGRFTELIDFNAYAKSIQCQQLTSYLLVMAPLEAKFNVKQRVKGINCVYRFKLLNVDSNKGRQKAMLLASGLQDCISIPVAYPCFLTGPLKVQNTMILEVCGDLEMEPTEIAANWKKRGIEVQLVDELWDFTFLPMKYVILSGCPIGREDPAELPSDVRTLKIFGCHNIRSLSDMPFFQQTNELGFCMIHDCRGIESVLDLSSPSKSCTPFVNLELLWLENLENLHVLVKVAEASVVSTLRSEEEEENHKGNGKQAPTKFCLPKLQELELTCLPELKSICSSNGEMVCNSLRKIKVRDSPTRMPLCLPHFLDTHQAAPSVRPFVRVVVHPKEWWESVEWDYPNAKEVLRPWLNLY